MESTLYQSAFAKGEAKVHGEVIIQVLNRLLGGLDPAVSQRIGVVTDRSILRAWQQEALDLSDAEGARRLAEKIRTTPLP